MVVAGALGAVSMTAVPEQGVASAQFVLDSPQSSLARVDHDLNPLSERAVVFARSMTSGSTKRTIATTAGIGEGHLSVTSLPAAGAPGGTSRASDGGSGYRVVVQPELSLPVVTIDTYAPTPRAARKLIAGARAGLEHYVEEISARQDVPLAKRIDIERLGTVTSGTVSGSANVVTAVLLFVVAALAGLVLVLVLDHLSRAWRAAAAAERNAAAQQL